MTKDISQHFPLTNAYLCQDCESIGNNAMHCPGCASDVLMPLEGVLNGPHLRIAKNRIFTEFPNKRTQIHIAA
jgi:hypothetical protein